MNGDQIPEWMVGRAKAIADECNIPQMERDELVQNIITAMKEAGQEVALFFASNPDRARLLPEGGAVEVLTEANALLTRKVIELSNALEPFAQFNSSEAVIDIRVSTTYVRIARKILLETARWTKRTEGCDA